MPLDQVERERISRMILEFVRDHPGCTRAEIEAHVLGHNGEVINTTGELLN